MDSENVKKAIIQQVRTESSTQNAQRLLTSIKLSCFEKCVPKPGTSLSGSEVSCVTNCMEKYMAAWNIVNTTYIERLKADSANELS